MNKIKIWYNNARPASLVQSLMPAIAAVVLNLGAEGFNLYLAILAVVGVACAHLSFNLMDDYFDYKAHQTGYRDTLKRAGFRAFTAKCPYITDGSATVDDLFKAVMGFFIVAVCCGIPILIYRGVSIFIVVAITGLLGVFYSGAPLRLSYHGLGELVIGTIFGPLNIIGVSLAACGKISGVMVMTGIVFGLLVTNILFCHSVLDYDADISVEKHTFADLLAKLFPGHKKEAWKTALFIFIMLPYAIVIGAVLLGYVYPWNIIVLLTLPLAISLYSSMKDHINGIRKEHYEWKRVYGNAGRDWEGVQKAGLDWFLVRWLMARNLVGEISACLIAAMVINVVFNGIYTGV